MNDCNYDWLWRRRRSIHTLQKSLGAIHSHNKSTGRKNFFFQTKYGQSEEIISDGLDLYVKNKFEQGAIRSKQAVDHSDNLGVPSDWTKLGNLETVERNRSATRWVLEAYADTCTHIFYTTVTSIHSVNTLKALVDHIPKSNVYAGMPGVFKTFFGYSPFIFISGSNTLLSSDIAKQILEYKEVDTLGLPNDVWLGLRLAGMKKICIPRYDMQKKPEEITENYNFSNEIDEAISAGHFHFRVKSYENRELTDHIILMDIYRKLYIGRSPRLADVIALSARGGLAK